MSESLTRSRTRSTGRPVGRPRGQVGVGDVYRKLIHLNNHEFPSDLHRGMYALNLLADLERLGEEVSLARVIHDLSEQARAVLIRRLGRSVQDV